MRAMVLGFTGRCQAYKLMRGLKDKNFFGTDFTDGHGYYLSFLKKSGTRFLETGCPPGGLFLATQVAEAQRPDSSVVVKLSCRGGCEKKIVVLVFETTRPLFEILLPGRWRRRKRTANGGQRNILKFDSKVLPVSNCSTDNLYGLFLISS
jgi:hypothetical protein